MADELRMNAYYYSFDWTGELAIDRVLSAVACAGKAFHHTDGWTDEAGERAGHTGTTPVDWIHNAAVDAAAELATLRKRLADAERDLATARASELARIASLLRSGKPWDTGDGTVYGPYLDAGEIAAEWLERGGADEARKECT